MVDIGVDIEKVHVVLLFGHFIKEALSVKWKKCKASTNGKVDLRCQDPTAQKHVVPIPEGSKYVDTRRRRTSIDDASKQVRSCIDDMSRDETTQRMSDDQSASLTLRDVWSIARQLFQILYHLATQ